MSFASHIRETGDENSIHIDAEVFRHPVEHDVCKVDVIGGGVGGCGWERDCVPFEYASSFCNAN